MEQTWNLPANYLRFGVGEGEKYTDNLRKGRLC